MKIFTIMLASLVFQVTLFGQSLQTGNIVGIHRLSIDLKPGVTMDEYLAFWQDIVLPVYRSQMEGVHMQTTYGLRGECDACMALMMIMESAEIRNKYWNADGGWTEYGREKLKNMQFVLDELNDNYGSFSTTYTDWLVNPDVKSLDLDLLGAPHTTKAKAIKGTWALIHGEYSGKIRQPAGEIFQYKMFDDNYFSLQMKSSSGKWDQSAVGTYSVDGHTYKETFLNSSREAFTGVTAKWDYQLSNDTLHIQGPTLIVDQEGKSTFPEMLNTMKEVRVRVD